MGKVIAICTSPAKGTQKTRIEEGTFIEDFGLEGDAHAGKWHRQISLLSYDKIEAFRARGAEVEDGAFGENVIVQGNPVSVQRSYFRDDTDWKRMSSWLSDLPENGRMYHAARRGICKSASWW